MGRRFNGTSDFISMGDVLDIERTDKFGLGGFFLPDAGSGAKFMIAKQDNLNVGEGYALRHDANGRITFALVNNQTTNLISVTGTRDIRGHPHHVFITYDGSSKAAGMKLYVDGRRDALTLVSDTLTATTITTESFQLGAREGATFEWFAGIMAEICVYLGIEPTPDEVRALADQVDPRRVRKQNLKGYWQLGGFDSPEKDLSGSAFDATLTGTVRASHPNRDPNQTAPFKFFFHDPVAGVIREFLLKAGASLQAVSERYIKTGAQLQSVQEHYIAFGANLNDVFSARYIKVGASLEGAQQRFIRFGANFKYSAQYIKFGAALVKQAPLEDLGSSPPATKAGLLSRTWLSIASVKKDVS